MRKTSDDGMELMHGVTVEERPAWPPPAPVVVCDLEADGERWDGLS